MAERPIIFSAEMVRAILDGRKTMTRRVITRNNSYYDGGSWPKKDFAFVRGGHDENKWYEAFTDSGPSPAGNPGPYLHLPVDHYDTMMQKHDRTVHRIYSRIWTSDLLWVREAFYESPMTGEIKYKTDGFVKGWTPRPSIHMPKSICRIWLKVKDVRVERLQDISADDAWDEGIDRLEAIELPCSGGIAPVAVFSRLWEEINAKRGYGWDVNPWVWVIEFERCEK